MQLFKHGGIPRLVALLKRGPKEAATSAVACLRDLAPHPDMVDVIVESEGIQVDTPFAPFLHQHDSADLRRNRKKGHVSIAFV